MAKKHKGIEYRMLVQPTYDETLKKAGTSFFIETVKQFSNFSYEIVVEETVNDKGITWTLHGLRAPELLMPSFGGAQFRKIYFGLTGTYTFGLKKADGEVNEFRMKILPTSVKLLGKPESTFVSLYTSEQLFEEKRPLEMEVPHHKPDIKRPPESSSTKKKK